MRPSPWRCAPVPLPNHGERDFGSLRPGIGLACLLLLAAFAACGWGREPRPLTLAVSVRSGAVVAPDTLPAGWVRLRVEEDGGGHSVVVFRIPGDLDDSMLQVLRVEMDTSRTTPPDARAYGGPEVGDTGEVILHLRPGRYLLGCVSRGADGHRHLAGGEWKVIDVLHARGRTAEPVATEEVQMAEFAYSSRSAWPAGEHVIQVENRGRQDHQLRIDRLRPGVTLQAWLAAPDVQMSDPVAGTARLGHGRSVYLPVKLPPGDYVIYCLVPDAASGKPHVMLGMFRGLKVD